ncbi:hypothetical protein BDR06DRAFT_1013004 [Suillus hirtellus]|nr:hypothetical protein BDR06DRAFT_1013004 [Suillus hirtellus]
MATIQSLVVFKVRLEVCTIEPNRQHGIHFKLCPASDHHPAHQPAINAVVAVNLAGVIRSPIALYLSLSEGNRGQTQSRRAKEKAPASTVAPADEDDGPQPEISPAPNTTKKLAIHWEGAYSACTSWLIAWCKTNDDAHIKLFSDSVKDAKDQGRKKKQSSTPKETYYLQLTNAIFSNDEDPEVWRLFQTKPGALIKPVQTWFGTCFSLKRKYNEFNKSLKQTGTGLTYNELQKNLQTKTLIDSQLNKFPWWPDLHGWWRTNPAYNTVFSTIDPGQNHESAALQHFCIPDHEDAQLPADENEPKEDADIEDGEIIDMGDVDTNVDACQEDINPVDTTNANAAGQVDDNIKMEQSDQFIHVQQAPTFSSFLSSTPGFFHGSTSTGSYTSLPRLRPPIAPISTCYFDQDAISLNSPEPPPDDQSDSQYSFFSGFKEPTSNHNTTPHDSDSDISTSNAMNHLQVDSHKASPCRGCPGSQIMKLSGGTTRSASPQSPQATLFHPPSHKCTNNNQASTTAAAEQLSETAQVLIQQVGKKCDGCVEYDHYKRMKLETSGKSKFFLTPLMVTCR